MTTVKLGPAAADEAEWLFSSAQRPAYRTLREFAEAEIVVPDGQYAGEMFRCDRQPFTGLLFDAIDSGHWNEAVITGPSQSGKTLSAFAIPVLYHLFEIRETVIMGLPDADMSGDKWAIDLRPVILKSRFADQLPQTGQGSRGGRKIDAITFENGSTLKVMTGGGGDKSRAAFTARVLIVTETDGMDEAGAASREADKLAQMQARQRSYPRQQRVTIKECTVSTESGHTWREYTENSTASRIACPCPHCGEWVTPEREHLRGWQEAPTIAAAMELAHFACPACGVALNDEQQVEMNRAGRLLHKGQSVTDLAVVGEPPETHQLGFRWSAFNNLFLRASDHAADEWSALQLDEASQKRLDAEKELRQFVWALPAESEAADITPLDVDELMLRVSGTRPGEHPEGHEFLTVGIDLRKTQAHWVAQSWTPQATGTVIQYGILKVHSRSLGEEAGIRTALDYWLENVFAAGFLQQGGGSKQPDRVLIDAGWQTDAVFAFCDHAAATAPGVFFPCQGAGRGKQYRQKYTHPNKVGKGSEVLQIGSSWHWRLNRERGGVYCRIDADSAKSWLHARWATPVGEPGALTIHAPIDGDHRYLFRQLTAERQVEEFVEGVGNVTTWETTSRVNHYLDASAYGATAARSLGVETSATVPEIDTIPLPPPPDADLPRMPDGRPFHQ